MDIRMIYSSSNYIYLWKACAEKLKILEPEVLSHITFCLRMLFIGEKKTEFSREIQSILSCVFFFLHVLPTILIIN